MKSNRHLWISFIFGGLLAAAAFVCIYGFRVLIPTYDDWLLFTRDGVDNMQHYQGWVAYRRSPWQFPLGLTEGILYPDRISVIYTDSVPLFAFIFKLLSPLLPETFQYFGIFGLLCAFLLGAFSAAFICRFTDRPLFSSLCALFFATAFVFLHRMFYHTALAAQWIVVASLFLWLAVPYKKEGFGGVRAVSWTLLSVTAILTEAYFLPMVWGIMLCDLIAYGLGKKDIRSFAGALVITMGPAAVFTVLIGWCFGLFYGDVQSSGLGLGVYTFNLINFVNPFWMSSVIPWLPSDFFQYEGLAYLGLGVLGLIPVAVVLWIRGRSKDEPVDISMWLPLVIFFVGFSVAAISPVVSIGDHRFTVPIPDTLWELWSTFRSCGRMIWPVYYLIILAVCTGLGRYAGCEKVAVSILMAALVIQMYDAHGYIEDLNEKFSTPHEYVSSLRDPKWDEIGKNYEHIAVCPDVHDVYYTYEGEELEYFALQKGLTMNIVYTAREVSKQVNERMEKELDAIRSGEAGPDRKTVYVFLNGKKDKSLPLNYYKLNGYTIGVAGEL
ncbi:MAG: DUF6311 domain-containing protein [Lachnospiraceae bacterium]|nr:DUF6311 domain-containing protein [Lachnospiraceae bacterium]